MTTLQRIRKDHKGWTERKYATCHCGKRFTPYHDKKHCSMSCYLSSALFPRAGITVQDVKDCHGMTIKDAAVVLGVSYRQLRRRIVESGLRDLFPNPAEGRWLSERGYAE